MWSFWNPSSHLREGYPSMPWAMIHRDSSKVFVRSEIQPKSVRSCRRKTSVVSYELSFVLYLRRIGTSDSWVHYWKSLLLQQDKQKHMEELLETLVDLRGLSVKCLYIFIIYKMWLHNTWNPWMDLRNKHHLTSKYKLCLTGTGICFNGKEINESGRWELPWLIFLKWEYHNELRLLLLHMHKVRSVQVLCLIS